jgi:hypothetical protein
VWLQNLDRVLPNSEIRYSMDVSIVIVSFNTKELTVDCLRSVYLQTAELSFEVIVVDNNSSDGSPDTIKREYPTVKLIINGKNVGFGAACNIGIKSSYGKYVFLLNPDTILLNNCLRIFYEFMERRGNIKVWCCGGMLYGADKTLRPAYGHFPSIAQVIIQQFGFVRLFGKYYENHLAVAVEEEISEPTDVPFVCGADMFVRRSSLNDIAMFDEEFYLYFEETYLSYLMAKQGLRSVILPEAKIIHLVGRSSSQMEVSRIGFYVKSEFLFFEKVYGIPGRFIVKSIRLVGGLFKLILKMDSKQITNMKIIWQA